MIINGKFEDSSYSLPGWTVYYSDANRILADVLIKTNTTIVNGQPGPGVDGNAARLYVYMCADARISQDILIDKNYLLFDWVTYTIAQYPENIGFRIKQGATVLYSEGIASAQNSHRNEKTHVVDVSAYLNQTVTIEFYIEASARCYFGDHGNNWLWVDNVELSDTTTPCVPNWQCDIPLNGSESDGCGNTRSNPLCDPCIPNWQCELPLNGSETDGCGNTRLNSICDSPTPSKSNKPWWLLLLGLPLLGIIIKKKRKKKLVSRST